MPPTVRYRLTIPLLYSLTTGTSVAIRGVWQHAPPGKEQKCELKADEVRIIGSTDAEVSVIFSPMDERVRKPVERYKESPINMFITGISYPEEIPYPRISPHGPPS